MRTLSGQYVLLVGLIALCAIELSLASTCTREPFPPCSDCQPFSSTVTATNEQTTISFDCGRTDQHARVIEIYANSSTGAFNVSVSSPSGLLLYAPFLDEYHTLHHCYGNMTTPFPKFIVNLGCADHQASCQISYYVWWACDDADDIPKSGVAMGVAGLSGVIVATALVGLATGAFVMRWRYKQRLEALEGGANSTVGSRSNLTHSPSRRALADGPLPPPAEDSPKLGDSPRNPLLRA